MNNISFELTVPLMDGISGTAKRFGIAEYHVRQLALSGKVKAVRAGGRGKILINQQSVAEYFNNSSLTDQNDSNGGKVIKPISVKGV